MPGSNASSDGFDRSPLHAEAGGEAEAELEVPPREDGPAEEAQDVGKAEDAPAEGQEAEARADEDASEKKEPNLGPTPQPSGSTTAGKIFCGGLTTDTVEQDLKAHFEVESLRACWGLICRLCMQAYPCAQGQSARRGRLCVALPPVCMIPCF